MNTSSSPLLTRQQLVPLFDDLSQHGLVLATAVSVQQLPHGIWLDDKAKQSGGCLLLGHGGRLFWELHQQTVPMDADPAAKWPTLMTEPHPPAIKVTNSHRKRPNYG